MAVGSGTNKNKGPCFWCLKCVKWIPVLFILTIVLWSYYAYVIQLCIFTIESSVKQVIYLIMYHLLFAMFIWSYWQTIFTDIARVPNKFKLPIGEYERLLSADSDEMVRNILDTFARNLPNTNRTNNGSVRYCEKCRHVKPDRTHHCSVCGECVLKMDHHCPWVNNCVCFTNYKFFILFLAYSLLYCIYIALTSLQYFVLFWQNISALQGYLNGMGRFHILFLFFVAAMFAISLASLFGYHCYLVAHNRTTLEAFRAPIFTSGPDRNGFSLGRYNNFQEVFGDNPRLWFLPISSSLGDGVVFPVQMHHQPMTYQSMDSTQTSSLDESTKLYQSQSQSEPGAASVLV